MSKFVNFLRSEPALILAFVQAGLSLLIGAGLHLTVTQAGSIEAAVAAAAGLVVAVSVKPFAVASLTGLIAAAGTLLITFGVQHVSAGLVSEVNAVVVAVLALLIRGNVTANANLPSRTLTAPAGSRAYGRNT